MRQAFAGVVFLALIVACADNPEPGEPQPVSREGAPLRVATFNVSLYRDSTGALAKDLQADTDDQLQAVRQIIRRVDPDILVLNEFDYDETGTALALFAEQLDQGYTHQLAIPSNTGVATGIDLDGDGRSDHPVGAREYGNDSFGYGIHPGQYAFAVLSRHPIDKASVRTFQTLLWKDMPGNLMPEGFYADEVQDIFRLSSKNHADIPVTIGDQTLHLILAHPTPPGFDGPEDRNGRRNYDEVRLLLDYVSGEDSWMVDDQGQAGALATDASFLIAGDLNADPVDGDRPEGTDQHAIRKLMDHPRVTDPQPMSAGGLDASSRQGGGNAAQKGDPALDTADFNDRFVGNLRVDYVLPSSDLQVEGSGVFWPAEGEPDYDLVGSGYPPVSSDHRLVWVDLRFPD
ncbi:MAG: endonuclease/exonuclease/phosphatase family protein [Pseudomonadota bacterium]